MNDTFSNYFQKSIVFLYPLLDMKNSYMYTPVETYICWENVYTISDKKLICRYNTDVTRSFKNFERKFVMPNKYLEDIIYLNKCIIYIYDMNDFNEEYINFLKGKYSHFKENYKQKINKYYSKQNGNNESVDSYLYPVEYHEVYADKLNVDIKIIMDTFELCSKPDLDKETLKLEYPK